MKTVSFDSNRRNFIKLVIGGGASLFFPWKGGSGRALAAIPGGTLLPADIPKFMAAMLIPPIMPKAGTIRRADGINIDSYEISVKEFSQQILPLGFPATKVWGYGAVRADGNRGLQVHNAPSLTIEASWNRLVRVKWINGLVDANGNCLPHLLPVDPTLHWANPPGGMHGRDTRPQFTSTPEYYTGPVPMVTHVHGAVGVGDESDGYAEAWYLPVGSGIPAGYASHSKSPFKIPDKI